MQQLPNKWDFRFLELAKLVSTWSKDTSSQMGACITTSDRRILSVGYNGICRHVSDDVPERHERPLKYKWFEHAERNAIYNAAASGVSIAGCTMHCMCTPCCDCARAIIQSGLSRVAFQSIIGKHIVIGTDISFVPAKPTCAKAMKKLLQMGSSYMKRFNRITTDECTYSSSLHS